MTHNTREGIEDAAATDQWPRRFLSRGTELGLGDLSMMVGIVSEIIQVQLQKAREEAVDELLTDIDFSYLLKEQERGEFGHVTSELERLAFKYRI